MFLNFFGDHKEVCQVADITTTAYSHQTCQGGGD